MNDLLWLANHPLWGNVVGIPTSRDPNTTEELESRLSAGIRKILAEVPHSTDLELRKLHWTWMDSERASTLELLWGLPTSQEVLRPSEPCLSLYSTKIEFGSPLGGGLNLTFFTLSVGGSTVVFIGGVRRCSSRIMGVWGPLVRAADFETWLGDHVYSLHRLSLIGYSSYRLTWTRGENSFWMYARTWPASQGCGASRPHFGSAGPGPCATSFLRVTLSMNTPGFGYNYGM
jgi:hypothetical protein